jgi:chorismate-pyruvate lyase
MVVLPQSPDVYEWIPVRQWRGEGLGTEMPMVLTVTSSLTRFIERRYGLRLELKLHDQFVDRLNPDEANLLGAGPGDACLRRTVSLLNRKSVMFDAESVLPLAGLPADLMAELEAGRQPLANLLLERGLSLARSDLCVGKHASESGEVLWARRSVLRSVSGTRALVSEYFHPEIWTRIGRRY